MSSSLPSFFVTVVACDGISSSRNRQNLEPAILIGQVAIAALRNVCLAMRSRWNVRSDKDGQEGKPQHASCSGMPLRECGGGTAWLHSFGGPEAVADKFKASLPIPWMIPCTISAAAHTRPLTHLLSLKAAPQTSSLQPPLRHCRRGASRDLIWNFHSPLCEFTWSGQRANAVATKRAHLRHRLRERKAAIAFGSGISRRFQLRSVSRIGPSKVCSPHAPSSLPPRPHAATGRSRFRSRNSLRRASTRGSSDERANRRAPKK